MSRNAMVRIGQYLYRPHRNMWGIYRRWESGNAHIVDFPTKEEARAEVYRLNGWK